ncbi:MAG: META domain-containing protein [Bacteroidales bacterium]|nr:META domain-containing protein [Bacteroidales bacterium]
MKKSLLIALLIASMFSSCGTSKESTPSLAGEWKITSVDNKEVKTEETPFLQFDGDKVHGKLGCNIYNTTITNKVGEAELTFSDKGQRTMMMCPDMEVEDAIIKALNETKSYRGDKNDKNKIELLNEAGNVVLVLKK